MSLLHIEQDVGRYVPAADTLLLQVVQNDSVEDHIDEFGQLAMRVDRVQDNDGAFVIDDVGVQPIVVNGALHCPIPLNQRVTSQFFFGSSASGFGFRERSIGFTPVPS